jgi:transcriptional regulator with GAF, ATPase, and Fis domain
MCQTNKEQMSYRLSAHFDDETRPRAIDQFLKESQTMEPESKGSARSRTMSSTLIGTSPKCRAVLEAMEMVAPVDSAVLVQRETGTGKELIAQAIHDASPRRQQRFVAIKLDVATGGLVNS